MRYWHARAAAIPDPLLRQLALDAQREKRGNIEGAAAFAALAPRAWSTTTIRLLVAWQAAYDYADLVAEQPCLDRSANGRQLHLALLRALQLTPPDEDYYSHYDRNEDGNYLKDMIDSARTAFGNLPNNHLVASLAQQATRRIIVYQALNQDDHPALARWAATEAPRTAELRWWETAAAGASSLPVLALLAAASDPTLTASDSKAIARAYFPWIGALHTLLDSLIDLQEDTAAGQTSLLAHYGSPWETAIRMQMLAHRALLATRDLPQGRRHALILASMASFYLTATDGRQTTTLASQGVLDALHGTTRPSILVMRARRIASRISAKRRPETP
jgi:tetraprenyl-beta-curcumene synthase